jgi:hypothetical protein
MVVLEVEWKPRLDCYLLIAEIFKQERCHWQAKVLCWGLRATAV